ncbi:MAG TPA: hypothetical protein VK173_10450, partial [Lacibacter sp.]|nr:hypothetical protein [Lacibacter sp.]
MKRILFITALSVFSFYSFAQDLCSAATNLNPVTSCGATASQDLQDATATGSPTNAAGTTNEVLYTFTTPAGITSVTITLTNPGSEIDDNAYIEAFRNGSCVSSSFTGISLGTSLVTTASGTSLSLSGLTGSTLYHFRVFTTAATTSNPSNRRGFSICVSYTAPLANDLCSSATNITPVTSCGATANQTLLNATTTGSPTNGAGTTRDVWYTFTTPANIRNVQIAASGFGTNLTSSNTYIEAFTASSCAAGVFTGTSIATTASGTSTLSLTNLTPS